MSYSNELDPRKYYEFTDIVGYLDYIVYAYAPDLFPEEEWLEPHEQMNMQIAFRGLRYGLEIVEKEKGQPQRIEEMKELIDRAEEAYQMDDIRGGMTKLEQVERILKAL